MSRIGKKPIKIPAEVEVKIEDNLISVKGPKGELQQILHPDISARVESGNLYIFISRKTKKSSALWGLGRALAANMIQGVTSGYEKKLEFEGVGFRANLEDDSRITLQLGFSHPVKFKAQEGVKLSLAKNIISVSGIDKQKVGENAARIRALKPPEPYKGKGIRYQGEVIRRKAGKKAVAAGS